MSSVLDDTEESNKEEEQPEEPQEPQHQDSPEDEKKSVMEEDGLSSSDEEEAEEQIMSPEEQFEEERALDPFEEAEEEEEGEEDNNELEHRVNGSPHKFQRSREGSTEKDSDEAPELEKESLSAALQNLMVDFHWPEGTSITIERVESTKVAVAELTASAIQSSTSEYSAASLQDLALIQSTLFTLQQQQIVQLQLIQQLLAQLAMCTEVDTMEESEPSSPLAADPLHPTSSRHHNNKDINEEQQRESKRKPPILPGSKQRDSSPGETLPSRGVALAATTTTTTTTAPEKQSASDSLSLKFASILNCGNMDPNRPLSPGLMSSYNFNSIMMPGGEGSGSGEQVNTLEMLQKRAQEVLDSASQGLLASSLVDENYRKTGVLDKREPFFKHRCRYCGKVFGSDSALQIHIRSHTGERPFKCNVCGSRFTTKGNLKVHFQRHSMKFPHVKMNPHPIPEHLDHFHPPILSNGERSPELIPSSLPFGPLPPFQPVNFMRFDDHAAKLRLGIQSLQESCLEPEDLSKASSKKLLRSSSSSAHGNKSSDTRRQRSRSRSEDDEDDLEEMKAEERKRKEERKQQARKQMDKESEVEDEDREEEGEEEAEMDDLDNDRDHHSADMDVDTEDSFTGLDQPENLSSKSLPLMHSIPLQATRPCRPSSASKMPPFQREMSSPSPSPKDIQQQQQERGSRVSSAGPLDDLSIMELAKDPRAYAALLPRPGSASSAWESLIEVNTSSETSKLQQLVDNIDNQISDPNECVVCHRVLSCKSALQMHYRTHTGERPFKCRLCGRAFTTKGNLKTHMGVHRIKEGDTHHQCPVCHKRFTTQLVLQQHIRLHTGEPTDLTIDQIRAGEIRDFIPNFNPNTPGALTFLHQPQQPLKSDSSRDTTPAGTPAGTPGAEVKFSTSLAALESQVRAVTTFAGGSQGIFPEDLSKKVIGSGPTTPSVGLAPNSATTAASTVSRTSAQSPATTDSELSSSDWARHSESDFRTTPPSSGPTPFLPLDLTPKNNMFSPFLPNLNPLMGNSALTSLANSVLNSTAAFNPVHMSVIAGREHFAAGAGRGNTTCSICLKTFACNSALEIHYRSHTKERPFKCTVCERGFSTKGNMKQHMLTHKIRDMPPSVFDGAGKLQSSSGSNKGESLPASQGGGSSKSGGATASSSASKASSIVGEEQVDESPGKDAAAASPPEKINNKELDLEKESSETPVRREKKRSEEHHSHSHHSHSHSHHHHHHSEERPVPGILEDDNSRNSGSGGSKHMCPVCQKSFSSSSSLHIHMRTHTGDKPFKCSVCQKAFTTKGNLKVHMGTHMWTSGASRRGRRMSLELPLGLQFQPPTGDGRMDGRNFFPFVPPNFPGGPVNLAAAKHLFDPFQFGDYSMFRPPVPFPMMMAPNMAPGAGGGAAPPPRPKNEEEEDEDVQESNKDEDEDPPSP